MKYIPASAALDGIVKDLSVNGIKVELYNKADQNFKTFYVGGMTNDERGTYFIMEGSNQPYVMHLPYWEGGVKYRFLMRPDDWKDRAIFHQKTDNIKRIAIEYPKQQGKSFQIEKDGSDYYVSSPFLDREEKKKIDQSKIDQYLREFVNPQAEAFKNDWPKMDSVRSILPFAIVEYENTAGDVKQVKFLPIRQEVNAERIHVRRYWADCSWGDLLMVQHPVFQKVFLSYDHWVK